MRYCFQGFQKPCRNPSGRRSDGYTDKTVVIVRRLRTAWGINRPSLAGTTCLLLTTFLRFVRFFLRPACESIAKRCVRKTARMDEDGRSASGYLQPFAELPDFQSVQRNTLQPENTTKRVLYTYKRRHTFATAFMQPHMQIIYKCIYIIM